MTQNQNQSDGTQNGPGEQVRPREDEANSNLDNQRGGADPSGGQSSEVPRRNGADYPGSENGSGKKRDITPLSTPSEGSPDARPTEDDLAKRESDRGDQ